MKRIGRTRPRKKKERTKTGGADRPSIVALGRLERYAARILGWEYALKPRGEALRPPLIDDNKWTDFPPGAGEILVAYYNPDWNLLETTASWARAGYFAESWNDKTGRLRGGQMPPRQDDRLFTLTPPDGAAYVLFFRSRIEPDPSAQLGPGRGVGAWGNVRHFLTPLGVFELPGFVGGVAQAPDNIPLPVVGILDALVTWSHIFPFPPPGWGTVFLRDGGEFASGWVDSEETLHGDPNQVADHFNIIITGDGFGLNEQTLLDQKAKALALGIMAAEPFHSLAAQINIHLVRVVSYNSGINRCSGTPNCDPTTPYPAKVTYFGAEGCWPPSGGGTQPWWACIPSSPGYLGIKYPANVYAAGNNFAPVSQVNLYIVLANATEASGSAFRSQKIATVPISTDLVEVGLHESAHVIADILEEYTPPLPWDGSTGHVNVTEAGETAAWLPLALNSELIKNRFRYVYDCPNPTTCGTSFNAASVTDPGNLGLYWGAQFIDATEDPCTLNLLTWNAYLDRKGRNFFRPMATCRMRVLNRNYCRACEAAIRAEILAP